MKTKKITVSEYAEIRSISPQAIRQAIKKGYKMPGVLDYQKFGKTYVLNYKEKTK